MDKMQFKQLFDDTISLVPNHGMSEHELGGIADELYDAFVGMVNEEPRQFQLPEYLAPILSKFLRFAVDIEHITRSR